MSSFWVPLRKVIVSHTDKSLEMFMKWVNSTTFTIVTSNGDQTKHTSLWIYSFFFIEYVC